METMTKVFVPLRLDKEVYYRGVISASENKTLIYLTKCISKPNIIINRQENPNIIYCYYGDHNPKMIHTFPNNLVIRGNMKIKQLTIGNEPRKVDNFMLLIYNYDEFRDSQTILNESDDFTALHSYITKENGLSQRKLDSKLDWFSKPYWILSSMFLQHVCNYINLLSWVFSVLKIEKKISIKLGNLILAILTDVLLGYVILNFVTNNKKYTSSQVIEMLEKLINMLSSLLTWLMGAPVGLKLNNAFNKMLGNYFSYHVKLWWMFLDTCSKQLDVILNVYQYIGYLGLTFQIAMISDIICIATFHAYCIYVYAARLFNIQISGLIALLRLFVGRKYNPLRGSIDSCEYTNQELFVGTVAFTILLLLLPTTALYYIVFTVFRVLSVSVQHTLAKTIHIIQALPLYVTTLWLIRSPKVAGNISIQAEHKKNFMPLIRVKLLNKSISELIQIFKPPIAVPRQVEWTSLLSNALMGKQII